MTFTPRKDPDKRRQEILEAAGALFYELGYQKASLRDISRRVKITQAAIYYHFQNKEEILYAIIDEFSNRLDRTLRDCLSLEMDPIEKLKETIKAHLRFMETDRQSIKILIEDKRLLGDKLGRKIKRREKTFFNLYKAYLKEMKDAGLLQDIDLTTATFGIFGQINWLYHWWQPKINPSIEPLAENIIKMIFYGLVKDKQVKPRRIRG
ncbi:MAG: TetR/AcrR family transcriptional regulator [Desulfarculaceae bacterium]|jgi:AcrR family transcriptional regulator